MAALEKLFKHRCLISAALFDKDFKNWVSKQTSDIQHTLNDFSKSFTAKITDNHPEFINAITGKFLTGPSLLVMPTKSNNFLFFGRVKSLHNFLHKNKKLSSWLDDELDKLAKASAQYQTDHPIDKENEDLAKENYENFLFLLNHPPTFLSEAPQKQSNRPVILSNKPKELEKITNPEKRNQSPRSKEQKAYHDTIDEIVVFVNTQKYNFEKKTLRNENETTVLLWLNNFNEMVPEKFDKGLTLVDYVTLARKLLEELLTFAKKLAAAPDEFDFFASIFMEKVTEFSQALQEIEPEEAEEKTTIKRSKAAKY